MPTDSSARPPAPPRAVSVDALRGFDMFFIVGMEEVFRALSKMWSMEPSLNARVQHVPWAGFHFYDLIFPLFAFIIGVSLVFSLSKSVALEGRPATTGKILRRSAVLYLLGILYYGGIGDGFEQVRLLGVLQRLALCFCAAGLAFVWMGPRRLIALTVTLLVGYWAMLSFVPVPGSGAGNFAEGHNLANWIDRAYLPLKKNRGDYDAEGLLSTLPAIATTLLGVFAGLLLKNPAVEPIRKVRRLLGWGAAGIALGLLWGAEFPVIKKIWTSSFVLLTGGISCLLLAGFYYVIDIRQRRTWCQPFVWIGMNAITIYLIVRFVKLEAIAEGFVGGEIRAALDRAWPGLGELAIALLALLFAVLICRFLFVRKIFLRV